MINVTQKSEREFIIEWDENDPQESIFNEFTEKDFIEVLTYYAERQLEVIEYSSKLKKKSRETNYYNSESEAKSTRKKTSTPPTKTTKPVRSTRQKSTARGISTTKTTPKRRKVAEIKVMNSRKIELFPWVGTFPYYMKDETENKKCWFTCEEHATKYIRRYNCKYKLYHYTGGV